MSQKVTQNPSLMHRVKIKIYLHVLYYFKLFLSKKNWKKSWKIFNVFIFMMSDILHDYELLMNIMKYRWCQKRKFTRFPVAF